MRRGVRWGVAPALPGVAMREDLKSREGPIKKSPDSSSRLTKLYLRPKRLTCEVSSKQPRLAIRVKTSHQFFLLILLPLLVRPMPALFSSPQVLNPLTLVGGSSPLPPPPCAFSSVQTTHLPF